MPMKNVDNATLASVCRAQASIASCAESRDVLLDMADGYDARATAALTEDVQEAEPEQIQGAPDTLA